MRGSVFKIKVEKLQDTILESVCGYSAYHEFPVHMAPSINQCGLEEVHLRSQATRITYIS
jgi:hypothetical protein